MTARPAIQLEHPPLQLLTPKLSAVRVRADRRGVTMLDEAQLRPVFSEIVIKAKAMNVMVSYTKARVNETGSYENGLPLHQAYYLLLESHIRAVKVVYQTANQLRSECFERLPQGVRRVYTSAQRTDDRSASVDLTQEVGSSPRSTGASLLAQHQELLSIIDETETVLAAALNSHSVTYHIQLVRMVTSLIAKLEVHFEAEGKNLDWDLEDAPELRAEFEALDAEHPQLLEHFRKTALALQQGTPIEEVALLLQRSIDLFRDHEAREDALFAWD